MSVYDVVTAMPDLQTLERRCTALALLDAVLSPEWEFRYYSFDPAWGDGERMASMRDGSGDSWSIVFSEHGAFIRGFARESVMNPSRNDGLWPRLLDGLPDVFAPAAEEPAFMVDAVLQASVCVWRQHGDNRWHMGDVELADGTDPDGADHLFGVLLDANPDGYVRFAADYYEQHLDADDVRAVLALEPLTDDLVRRLNPDLSLAELTDDVAQIHYPVQ